MIYHFSEKQETQSYELSIFASVVGIFIEIFPSREAGIPDW